MRIDLKVLRSRWSVPGWIVLGWIVLGEIHEGKFALDVFGVITDFFQHHVFYGLLIGFGMLFLAGGWDALTKRFPWLKFQTIHDRVHALELHLQPLESESTACRKDVSSLQKNHPVIFLIIAVVITVVAAVVAVATIVTYAVTIKKKI